LATCFAGCYHCGTKSRNSFLTGKYKRRIRPARGTDFTDMQKTTGIRPRQIAQIHEHCSLETIWTRGYFMMIDRILCPNLVNSCLIAAFGVWRLAIKERQQEGP
jgi:hypothetical protein